ncbi:MAG: hypothetical protein EA344_11850, partial [Alkalicoccus sp.]
GRAEDPFRMELAEGGPLGKPLHGNESERSFFYFQGSLFVKRISIYFFELNIAFMHTRKEPLCSV